MEHGIPKEELREEGHIAERGYPERDSYRPPPHHPYDKHYTYEKNYAYEKNYPHEKSLPHDKYYLYDSPYDRGDFQRPPPYDRDGRRFMGYDSFPPRRPYAPRWGPGRFSRYPPPPLRYADEDWGRGSPPRMARRPPPPYGGFPRPHARGGFMRRRFDEPAEVPPRPSRVLAIFGLNVKMSREEVEEWAAALLRDIPVSRLCLIRNKRTGLSKGFAFVYFHSLEDAEKAKDLLAGQVVAGQEIRVDYSMTTSGRGEKWYDGEEDGQEYPERERDGEQQSQ